MPKQSTISNVEDMTSYLIALVPKLTLYYCIDASLFQKSSVDELNCLRSDELLQFSEVGKSFLREV